MDSEEKLNQSIQENADSGLKECERNVLEPILQMGFVAIGPTSDIYRVSKAFAEVLKEYPKVKVLYHRTSLGRLWIVDGKPDG